MFGLFSALGMRIFSLSFFFIIRPLWTNKINIYTYGRLNDVVHILSIALKNLNMSSRKKKNSFSEWKFDYPNVYGMCRMRFLFFLFCLQNKERIVWNYSLAVANDNLSKVYTQTYLLVFSMVFKRTRIILLSFFWMQPFVYDICLFITTNLLFFCFLFI